MSASEHSYSPVGGDVLAVPLPPVPPAVTEKFNGVCKAEFFTVVKAGPRALVPIGAIVMAVDDDRKTVRLDGADYRLLSPSKIHALVEANG